MVILGILFITLRPEQNSKGTDMKFSIKNQLLHAELSPDERRDVAS